MAAELSGRFRPYSVPSYTRKQLLVDARIRPAAPSAERANPASAPTTAAPSLCRASLTRAPASRMPGGVLSRRARNSNSCSACRSTTFMRSWPMGELDPIRLSVRMRVTRVVFMIELKAYLDGTLARAAARERNGSASSRGTRPQAPRASRTKGRGEGSDDAGNVKLPRRQHRVGMGEIAADHSSDDPSLSVNQPRTRSSIHPLNRAMSSQERFAENLRS